MPTLRVRASTFTPSVGTWVNAANAVTAGDGNYATWTDASRRGSTTVAFGGFNFSAIPAGSVINSVHAELRHYESSTANIASVTVNGTAVTLATAARVDSVALSAVLPSSVEVVGTRANNTTSSVLYLDWLEVIVDYTEPPKSGAFNGTDYTVPEVWNGTRWVVPEVWNGSRWVVLGGF